MRIVKSIINGLNKEIPVTISDSNLLTILKTGTFPGARTLLFLSDFDIAPFFCRVLQYI